jgi:hypothetical protein
MTAHGEAAAGEAIDLWDAPGEFKDAAAGFAMEVMVMRLAGPFIDRCGAG